MTEKQIMYYHVEYYENGLFYESNTFLTEKKARQWAKEQMINNYRIICSK